MTRRRLTWHAFRACALGGVLFAADIGLGFTAIKATTVADVAIIGALAPVVIVVVSAYRLGERVTLRAWLLTGASFTGVVIVALASAGSPSWSLTGDVLAFLSIGTWSLYWFFSRHVRDRFDPIVYFACVMLAGAIAMTPVALVTEGLPTGVSRGDLFAVVAVALLPGFVGHTLVIWSHKHVASWLSALITQVSPVITAVLAWVVLGEALTARGDRWRRAHGRRHDGRRDGRRATGARARSRGRHGEGQLGRAIAARAVIHTPSPSTASATSNTTIPSGPSARIVTRPDRVTSIDVCAFSRITTSVQSPGSARQRSDGAVPFVAHDPERLARRGRRRGRPRDRLGPCRAGPIDLLDHVDRRALEVCVDR